VVLEAVWIDRVQLVPEAAVAVDRAAGAAAWTAPQPVDLEAAEPVAPSQFVPRRKQGVRQRPQSRSISRVPYCGLRFCGTNTPPSSLSGERRVNLADDKRRYHGGSFSNSGNGA
jgi:hypothetical protein